MFLKYLIKCKIIKIMSVKINFGVKNQNIFIYETLLLINYLTKLRVKKLVYKKVSI